MWSHVAFRCRDNGCMWPGVALCLWLLALRLAPRNLVSNANAQISGPMRPPNRPPSFRQAGDLAADVALPPSHGGPLAPPRLVTYNFLYVYSCGSRGGPGW